MSGSTHYRKPLSQSCCVPSFLPLPLWVLSVHCAFAARGSRTQMSKILLLGRPCSARLYFPCSKRRSAVATTHPANKIEVHGAQEPDTFTFQSLGWWFPEQAHHWFGGELGGTHFVEGYFAACGTVTWPFDVCMRRCSPDDTTAPSLPPAYFQPGGGVTPCPCELCVLRHSLCVGL